MKYKFPNTVYEGSFDKIEEELKEAFDEYHIYNSKKNTLLELLDLMMATNTFLQEKYTKEEIKKGMKQLHKKLEERGVVIE